MRKILNLGCGNDFYGTHRLDMFPTPATTHVIDLSQNKLPFPDQFFDEVKMYGILEHLKNVGFLIDEVYRVCKSRAIINVSTDHAGWLWWYTKKREHNKYLGHYYNEDTFKHDKGTDAHHYLFVESHLKVHFHKFGSIEVTYGYHARNSLIKFFLQLIPNHMGAREIKATVIK